jgi:hypothetical protein
VCGNATKGKSDAIAALMQIAQDGIPQVRANQPRRRCQGVQRSETSVGPLAFSDGHRTIHRV